MTHSYDTASALDLLTKLARRYPALEAQPIWTTGSGWEPMNDDDDLLDSDEVVPYCEGLMAEGFSFAWQVLGDGQPEFLRLFFWQTTAPDMPQDTGIIDFGVCRST